MIKGVAVEPTGSEPDLLTPAQAAARLAVHRSTLGRWANAEPPLIASVLLRSGHRRYLRADIEAILTTGRAA